jgi:hypothetical protein
MTAQPSRETCMMTQNSQDQEKAIIANLLAGMITTSGTMLVAQVYRDYPTRVAVPCTPLKTHHGDTKRVHHLQDWWSKCQSLLLPAQRFVLMTCPRRTSRDAHGARLRQMRAPPKHHHKVMPVQAHLAGGIAAPAHAPRTRQVPPPTQCTDATPADLPLRQALRLKRQAGTAPTPRTTSP